MPFQPYNGGGQDPLQMLLALQQLKQGMAEQEARRREQALAVGMKLIEAGGRLEGADPQVQQMLGPVYEAVQQDRQRTGLNTALEYSKPVIGAATPYYDEAGRLVQPDQGAALGALRQLGTGLQLNPQTQAILETLSQSAVQGGTAAQKAARAEEVRQDREARGRAAQSAALQAAENRRQESFQRSEAQRRESVINQQAQEENWAARLSAFQTGAGDATEANAVALEMAEAGIPLDAQKRVFSAAKASAYKFKTQTLMTEGADEANTSAIAGQLDISPDEVRLLRSNFGKLDPITGRVAIGQFGKDWADRRLMLGESVELLGGLEDAFYRASKQAAIDPLTGGPLVGSNAAQQFFKSMGVQGSAAAEYETLYRSYVLSAAKAAQGARASDMDLRFILAQIPTLEEVFSPSAGGRFKALKDMQRVAIEAPLNRSLGKQVASRKQGNAGLMEAMSMVSDYEKTGDFETFNQRLNAWKGRYGSKFSLPGVGNTSQPAEEGSGGFADEFYDTTLGGP